MTSGKKKISFWRTIGPGIITGASDDDPSGITTYSQAGAMYGLNLLWLSWFSFPLMAHVQEMCARIGIVSRRGLLSEMTKLFPKWFLFFCVGSLLIVNTVNIGADIAAMVAAAQLVFDFPTVYLVMLFAALSLALQLFLSYHRYAQYLKWMAMSLLLYVFSAISLRLSWESIFKATLIPFVSLRPDVISMICAVLGTTISPYLFFWQASQEVEEIRDQKEKAKIVPSRLTRLLQLMKLDVWLGMFLSNVIMFFVIVSSAAVFEGSGKAINTAADAARALEPIAGRFSFMAFALGILGTGLLAIPVLAGSSAYALSDLGRWRQGLNEKINVSYKFYAVIVTSVILGGVIAIFWQNPIQLLIAAAILNGIIASPLIFAVTKVSSSGKIMGDEANTKFQSFFGYGIAMLMGLVGIATIWFSLF